MIGVLGFCACGGRRRCRRRRRRGCCAGCLVAWLFGLACWLVDRLVIGLLAGC